ncbi:MAG: TIGR02757 family protein [Bacteroidota bacterium]
MNELTFEELKYILEKKFIQYNQVSFVESDPICIPHQFTKKADIEVSAFLTSAICWGQRKAIIKSANYLMQLMDFDPYLFVINSSENEINCIDKFYYRTFNAIDVLFFVKSLKNIYLKHNGLENAFSDGSSTKEKIINFRKLFFEKEHLNRTEKHISNVEKKAAAKRINLFLRWMIRKDKYGVDFGIWNNLQSKDLIIPLDVHSSNIARKFGLLNRVQNDWLSAELLTNSLKQFDKNDPFKYDFALFGMGVFNDI